jgi:probable H4MPT-linked C1 transfer pathway protein
MSVFSMDFYRWLGILPGMIKILGLDIGGANTKLASSDGKIAESHYVPLWKGADLSSLLRDIAGRLAPIKVGVVMTGELADCFQDKESGIRYILGVVKDAFGWEVKYLDKNGVFVRGEENLRDLASANWVASSLLAGRMYGDCILVDVGSTTSDIIPIKNGVPLAEKTDFERLKRSELVYAGVLRTSIASLLGQAVVEGERCRVSSEYFAITGDVYLVLGHISPEEYTCETPDNKGKNREDALRRLARVVCADLEEISQESLQSLAKQVFDKQTWDLALAIKEVAYRHGLDRIVACGLGEFLVEAAGSRLDMRTMLISDEYGMEISRVFPAYAVARLLETS